MLKKCIQKCCSLVSGYVITTWLAPAILPALIAVIGVVQNIPLFYILVAVSIAFGGVSTGLLRFSEWRYRNRVQDKLVFQSVMVNPKLDEKSHIVGVSFRINVTNTASFPVEFKVTEAFSKFNGKHPYKYEQLDETVLLSPDGTGFYDDGEISTGYLSFGNHIGEVKCRIVYGREGRLNYELNLKQFVVVGVDGNGFISGVQPYEYLSNV